MIIFVPLFFILFHFFLHLRLHAAKTSIDIFYEIIVQQTTRMSIQRVRHTEYDNLDLPYLVETITQERFSCIQNHIYNVLHVFLNGSDLNKMFITFRTENWTVLNLSSTIKTTNRHIHINYVLLKYITVK